MARQAAAKEPRSSPRATSTTRPGLPAGRRTPRHRRSTRLLMRAHERHGQGVLAPGNLPARRRVAGSQEITPEVPEVRRKASSRQSVSSASIRPRWLLHRLPHRRNCVAASRRLKAMLGWVLPYATSIQLDPPGVTIQLGSAPWHRESSSPSMPPRRASVGGSLPHSTVWHGGIPDGSGDWPPASPEAYADLAEAADRDHARPGPLPSSSSATTPGGWARIAAGTPERSWPPSGC